MADAGLIGVTRRRRVKTTIRGQEAAPVPDLANRDFRADTPNNLWIADITYVPTSSGFLYLSVVIDVFSRRVVGWAMDTHLRTELVLKALEMATSHRRPEGVIHHNNQADQGTG